MPTEGGSGHCVMVESQAVARRRMTGKRKASSAVSDSVWNPPQLPIRTLVINLARRRDRWNSISERLRPLETGGILQVERLEAVDASQETIPESSVGLSWTTDRNAKYDGREGYHAGVQLDLSPGERGCAMSHVTVWRTLDCEPVLVLEDDAVPGPRFAHHFKEALRAVPEGSDALYLGHINGAPLGERVAKNMFVAEYLWTTVAYLLWPQGARRLLAALPVDEPVDNFMAWQMSTGQIRVLAMEPPLVEQELEWDEKSDVKHSDDAVFGD